MFQVTASLNQFVLDDVMQGLQDEGIQGVTVTHATGRGCTLEATSALRNRALITVLVPDEAAKECAMEAIRAHAQDTEHGSGKMWVTPVLEIERIRTGEKNHQALATSNAAKEIRTVDVDAFNTIDTPTS